MLRVNQLNGFGATRGTGGAAGPAWFPVFAPALGELDDSTNWGGRTFRQLVTTPGLSRDAAMVRFHLRASSTLGFNIDEMWFGQQAASGDVYDLAASPALAPVKFFGSTSLTAPANQTIITDTVPFALDKTKNHVLSWHMVAPSTSSGFKRNYATQVADWGFSGYYSPALVNEAAVLNVSSYLLNTFCTAIMTIEGANETVWETAFAASYIGAFSDSWFNVNLRQVLPAAGNGGTQVRLILQAGLTQGWHVDAMWIGEQAASGDVFDMKTSPAPVQIKVGGATAFGGAIDSTVLTDEAAFRIDPAKTYVVAAHFDAATTLVNTSDVTGTAACTKTGASEAHIADVTAYSISSPVVRLIKRVEVTR